MEQLRELTTKEKALKINLNPLYYGSFAEIGAGQEIADHFFKAGGASGTIAKSMSAYDMQFSDAIYGKTKRYVSQERLDTMLKHEYDLLHERLRERKDRTCFFALANTVEALNFRKTNRGHGWIGLRFQLTPNSEPNTAVIHIVLKDSEVIWQQEAIGIIGVNLIYACFHFPHSSQLILQTLMEGLNSDRIEVDMARLEGPNFEWVDNRLLSLNLVKNGMTEAAMFGPNGAVAHASEVLYKKNILILRGRFRPLTHVNLDMRKSGFEQFVEEPDVDENNTIVLSELTLRALTADGKIEEKDFLDRVDILNSLGHWVLVSNYTEYYRLISYLLPFTRGKKVGIVLGVYNMELIFDESYYQDLRGGILESFGILFGSNIKLFVYPARKDYTDELYTCNNFRLAPDMQHLFQYLHASNKIEDITGVDPNILHITSDEVLSMIKAGKPGWEAMVPVEVEDAVKERGLFGYTIGAGAS
ncbi:MAG: TonB-dependent receptor [Bacteroidia bacterium]|nr:TonB-dependent receptor [Bacteroidia bacterium]